MALNFHIRNIHKPHSQHSWYPKKAPDQCQHTDTGGLFSVSFWCLAENHMRSKLFVQLWNHNLKFLWKIHSILILARQEDGYIFRFDALDLTLLMRFCWKKFHSFTYLLWKNVRDRCRRAWKSCNMVCTFHLCSYEHHIWVQVWTCENPCASMTKGTLHTFQRVIWSKLFVEPSPVDHTEAKWQAARKGKPARQGKSRNPSGSLGPIANLQSA